MSFFYLVLNIFIRACIVFLEFTSLLRSIWVNSWCLHNLLRSEVTFLECYFFEIWLFVCSAHFVFTFGCSTLFPAYAYHASSELSLSFMWISNNFPWIIYKFIKFIFVFHLSVVHSNILITQDADGTTKQIKIMGLFLFLFPYLLI